MKVQLVNPPVEPCYSRCSRAGCFPPLDLLSLASFTQDCLPDVGIEILDGEIQTQAQILDRISADIVGISPKVFSYKSALGIAEHAKTRGARVVMGGPWVSAMPERVLANRPFVDAVVIGDGEQALLALAKGCAMNDAPNTAYRRGGDVGFAERVVTPLDELPPLNYGLVAFDVYTSNYRVRFPHHPFRRPVSYYSQKGCLWFDKSGGCVFCRHHLTRNSRRSPTRFWMDIAYLTNVLSADLVWDVSDSFTMPRQWVRDLADGKPQGVHCQFYLYSRASDIDQEMIDLLRSLDCYELLIGVESGDDELLRRANKGVTRTQVMYAIDLCAKAGIGIFPTFVLGLPGESARSIQDTLSLGRTISRYENVHEMSSAVLIPLPGSQVFTALRSRLGNPSWLTRDDDLDLARVQNAYVSHFTAVSLDELILANHEIGGLCGERYRSSFGVIADPKAPSLRG